MSAASSRDDPNPNADTKHIRDRGCFRQLAVEQLAFTFEADGWVLTPQVRQLLEGRS